MVAAESAAKVGASGVAGGCDAIDGLKGGSIDGNVARLGRGGVGSGVSGGLGLGGLSGSGQLDGLLGVSVGGVGSQRAGLSHLVSLGKVGLRGVVSSVRDGGSGSGQSSGIGSSGLLAGNVVVGVVELILSDGGRVLGDELGSGGQLMVVISGHGVGDGVLGAVHSKSFA